MSKMIFSFIFIAVLLNISQLAGGNKINNLNRPMNTTDRIVVQQYDQYGYKFAPCYQTNCDDIHGTCISQNICKCNKEYAEVTPGLLACQYERKKESLAFLLEFLFFIGVGHFYSGRIVYGLVKLIYIVLVIIFDCCIRKKLFLKFDYNSKFQVLTMTTVFVLYFTILLWQIIDLCLIGLISIKDGNGIPLQSWD